MFSAKACCSGVTSGDAAEVDRLGRVEGTTTTRALGLLGHDGAAAVAVAAVAALRGSGCRPATMPKTESPVRPRAAKIIGGRDGAAPRRPVHSGEADEQDAGGGEAGGETVGGLHRLGHVEAGDEGDAPGLGPHPADDGADADAEAEQGRRGGWSGRGPARPTPAGGRRRSTKVIGRRPVLGVHADGGGVDGAGAQGGTGRPRPSSRCGRSRGRGPRAVERGGERGRGRGSSSRRTAYVIPGIGSTSANP